MSIDKQRSHAVEMLTRMGHRWDGTQWISPAPLDELAPTADVMHGLLMHRAERLAGCIEDSAEEAELEAISNALEADPAPEGYSFITRVGRYCGPDWTGLQTLRA